MPLSITIMSPMPGASLNQQLFEVCGTAINQEVYPDPPVDRNLMLHAGVTVTLSKGGTTFQTVPGVPCGGGRWKAIFAAAPLGLDYVITARITDGTDTASHSIETVDVVMNPRVVILQPVACCAGGGGGNPQQMLKFGVVAHQVHLSGVYVSANPTGILGVVQRVAKVSTITASPAGGTHKHVRYSAGPYHSYAPGQILNATDWDLTIDVDYDTYVVVYLEENGQYPAFTASQLF